MRLTLLRLLAGTLRVDRSLMARLSEVKTPQGESRLVAALDLFRARVAEDADLLARLRRRWNAVALDRQSLRDDAANARLAALWSEIGSRDCAAYFHSARGRVYGLAATSSSN